MSRKLLYFITKYNMDTLLFDLLPDELISIIITYIGKNNPLIRISDRYDRLYDQYIDEVRKGFQMPFPYINPKKMTVYRLDSSNVVQHSTSLYYYTEHILLVNFYEINPFSKLAYKAQFDPKDIIYFIYMYLNVEDSNNTHNYKCNYKFLYLTNQGTYKYIKIKFGENEGWNNHKRESYESKNWLEIWNLLEDSDKDAILYSFFA